MNTEQLLASITPQVYQRLLYAIETGRWPDGGKLTQAQRDSCMQAVMMYQAKHNENPDHMSIDQRGEIHIKSKMDMKKEWQLNQGEAIFSTNPNLD